MESHRLKDDEESVRAALSSLKTATGIPVTDVRHAAAR